MNEHKRYIPIIIIKTKYFSFSYSIGNPLWFIYEFKKLLIKSKGENNDNIR